MLQFHQESESDKLTPFMKIVLQIVILVILSTACRHEVKPSSEKGSGENLVIMAERFSLEKNDGYTLLRILNPWQGTGSVIMEYYLVDRNSPVPEDADSSRVIFVPVRKVVCMSTTHAAMISELGELNSIAGISGSEYIFSDRLRQKIKTDNIPDVGYEAGLNNEVILRISPDLVMMYGIGGESAGYTGRLEELGVKVLFNADYLEKEPLARAEWIKLFGALYCKDELADSIFKAEITAYERVRDSARASASRPKVLLGFPYKDTWYVSPGNSYISVFISDAGGEYLWSDSRSDQSMPVGLENVYMKAMRADFWLNIGTVTSRKEIVAADHRFADLPCFKKGNLFNNNGRINETGGNDYWETGTLHPHLVLRDMGRILHPEIFGSDKLHFYRKVI